VQQQPSYPVALRPQPYFPSLPDEAFQSPAHLAQSAKTFRGRCPDLQRALKQHIPRMVPEALRQKAAQLGEEACRQWEAGILWQVAHRAPRVGNVGQLREWLSFLRGVGGWIYALCSCYRCYAPTSTGRAGPLSRYYAEVNLRRELSNSEILRLAWPLLYGDWHHVDQSCWLSTLNELYVVDSVREYERWIYPAVITHLWDVIRGMPGMLRPRMPRRYQTHFDFDDALDVAVRWCDQEEARASRRCRRRLALAGPPEERPPEVGGAVVARPDGKPAPSPTGLSPEEAAEQYVTLDKMAASVQRSKRTLEKLKTRPENPLPAPAVEGGGGKPAEWLWSVVRPWLEKEYGRRLPVQFPDARFRDGRADRS
jgi:hypothetical protein